jgi:hypothetical protein
MKQAIIVVVVVGVVVIILGLSNLTSACGLVDTTVSKRPGLVTSLMASSPKDIDKSRYTYDLVRLYHHRLFQYISS